MSNDVVVDIPIEDIRAGVRAEIDSDLGGIAAQVFEKAKASTAFRDKTGRLRQSIWIYRSKYKDGGYVVYVKAPHSHLVEFGHARGGQGRETVLEAPGAGQVSSSARPETPSAARWTKPCADMLGDAHFGKRR